MAQGNRVKGFVVGHDKKGQMEVWKVRVKDQSSHHDGSKFEVASVHPGVELKPSTDVTFRIEPLQVEGEFVLKAVDVATGTVTTEPSRQPVRSKSEGSPTMFVCVTEMVSTGDVNVFLTGFEDIQEARSQIDETTERVLGLLGIDLQPPHLGSEELTGLEIIERLSWVDTTRDAIEYLLAEVFKFGQTISEMKGQ